MKVYTKYRNPIISVLLCLSIITSTFMMSIGSAYALISEDSISYSFTGEDADTAGYAQGTVTISSEKGGTYALYWADKDEKPLDGYYEITSMTLSQNQSKNFEFGYHTAIPADAEKIIAVKSGAENVSAVYTLPENKKLPHNSNETLYTFNSYSDIHIDAGNYYVNAEKNWAAALEFAANKNTDFIVSSGDSITNASGPKKEWDTYERILADSSYLNPVYESNGNHDLRTGVKTGTKAFVKASGTDNTIENFDANKPYYSVTEKSTGDIFIFMALEYVYNPSSEEEFSDEQLRWVENLLEKNYGKGVNIYIVEHSHIQGYGAGDDTSNPYYKAGLSTQYLSTVKFKSLLQKYPDIIWMSGHTHEDYNMGFNYSNENGTACNMIHNSAIAGPTHPSKESHSLDYTFYDGLSQGYYVEVYDDSVIFYGANVCDEKIYPAYSYIMNGSRQSSEDSTNPTDPIETTASTAATGSTLGDGVETNTYYFVNTLKWGSIDCYAWSDDDTTTCTWPGYACTYFATDEYGNDIYYANVPTSLDKIIFNNGGNGKQTQDIILDSINNCFTPDGTTTSNKYNVKASIWYGVAPANYAVTEPSALAVSEESPYILCHYVTGSHGWSDFDTYFTKNGDGTYSLKYTASSSENISLNVYDKTAGKYNCVADSTNFSITPDEDKTETFNLASSSSRGKSITIKGVAEGTVINFLYNPEKNTLKISYSADQTEPESTAPVTEPDEYVLCHYITGTHGWSDFDTYFTKNDDGTYSLAYEASSSENISLNVYNKTTGTYNCVAESSSFSINPDDKDKTETFNLSSSTDRKSSLTIRGVSEGVIINFLYNPEENTLKVSYDLSKLEQETTTPTPTYDDTQFLLCHYITGEHTWADLDTYFTKNADNTFSYSYTAKSNESISLNVYDRINNKYNCVAESSSFSINPDDKDKTETFNLSSSTDRKSSLTIRGVSEGAIINFLYNPDKNTLQISYDLSNIPQETTVPDTEPTDESTAPDTEPTDESTVPDTEPTNESTAPSTEPTTETTPQEDYLLGDVDDNGVVEIGDATLIQLYLAKFTTLSSLQLKAADVDGNDDINIRDATYIQLYLARFIDELPAADNSIELNMKKAKEALDYYYQFSSYDQYQAVKKLYYSYLALENPSKETQHNTSIKLKNAIKALEEIADYIIEKDGGSGYTKDLVVYFAAPDSWLNNGYTIKVNVCFDKSDNAWGQHNMIQTTDKYNGLTVFRYTYSRSSFYSNSIDTVQFQAYDGSTWKEQFVAIESNTLCDTINGKLYNSGTKQWVTYTPTEGTEDVVGSLPDAEYALCFYSDSHGWDALDTFFTKQSGEIYTLDYTVPQTGNMSCNVYKFADSTYNCVEASISFDIINSIADSKTFTLSASTSRGKSITLNGAPKGTVISFVYDSNANTLTISYDLTQGNTDPNPSDYVLCYYSSNHAWSDRDTFFNKESDNVYTLTYTSGSDNDISLNVYNIADNTYNCVEDSTSVTITEGTARNETYQLICSSSRGKSLTVKGIKTGMDIKFTYYSDTNTLSLSYNI